MHFFLDIVVWKESLANQQQVNFTKYLLLYKALLK